MPPHPLNVNLKNQHYEKHNVVCGCALLSGLVYYEKHIYIIFQQTVYEYTNPK